MIIDMKKSQFINDYGNAETYVKAEINMRLSGHCNTGSSYCSDWDCGNCDGGRCETCREIYSVIIYEEPVMCDEGYMVIKLHECSNFIDLDEAKAYFKKKTKDMI